METDADAGAPAGGVRARRRRRLALALGMLLVAGAVVAIVLGTRSPARSAADNASSVAGAATVQRRNLVETDTESGTLGYADPQTVYNRLSGTITWLPAVGELIEPGHVLYRVDNRPVLLLNGATPPTAISSPPIAPDPTSSS